MGKPRPREEKTQVIKLVGESKAKPLRATTHQLPSKLSRSPPRQPRSPTHPQSAWLGKVECSGHRDGDPHVEDLGPHVAEREVAHQDLLPLRGVLVRQALGCGPRGPGNLKGTSAVTCRPFRSQPPGAHRGPDDTQSTFPWPAQPLRVGHSHCHG